MTLLEVVNRYFDAVLTAVVAIGVVVSVYAGIRAQRNG